MSQCNIRFIPQHHSLPKIQLELRSVITFSPFSLHILNSRTKPTKTYKLFIGPYENLHFCSYPNINFQLVKEKHFKNGISSNYNKIVPYFLHIVNWGCRWNWGYKCIPRFFRYVSKTCSFKRSCIQNFQIGQKIALCSICLY